MEYSQNGKNLRLGAAILAYVLIAALFFGIGYLSGRRNGRIQLTEEMSTQTEAVTARAEEEEIIYRVKIQGGRLYIYEIAGDEITVEAECEISEGVYPSEDIEELKQGIDFHDKNKAQSMFEDFSS